MNSFLTELRPADLRAALDFEWMLSWRRRRQRGTLIVGVLPVLFTILVVVLKWIGLVPTMAIDILPFLFGVAYVPILLLIIPLLLGTNLIAREAEANTLVFLLVRPISRASLLVVKAPG